MGSGSSSTRRLTLENEEKANNIIQLSSDVVKRLKECQPEVRSSYKEEAVPFPALPEGQVPSYHYDPRLITSLQSQQEKIVALKKNDEYWEKRLCDLEDCHKNIDKVMEGEFNKAIAEFGSEKKLYPCDVPPCQISKKKVIECYKQYPNQPMKCLKEVEAFTECVNLQRSILINNKDR